MHGEPYWRRRRLTRRATLRGAAAAGGGLTALTLAACGGGKETTSTGSTGTTAQATVAQAVLDPTKGKQGGKIVIQQYGDPGGGLELVKIRNAGVHQFSGFTHDGLLEAKNGTTADDGYSIEAQPNLAQAMPEQPDPLTFVFKLRPAKFHNGRTVTSADVKYSYELYAGPDSAWKSDMVWLEKVDTPDPQTVVVKAKFAYADAPQAMAARDHLEILAKEHQESPEAEKKLMGSGAFLFVDYQPPVMSRYKRNPEYHRQPYPYFEEIDFLGTSDTEKKIADFAARQVQMTYYFPPEGRDRVKQVRPDAQLFSYLRGADALFMRTDKPPFNDKRVRQALSMAIDRKALSQGVTQGEGEPDQTLSIAGKYWGFRKPSEMGAAAKYWNYDPQGAKQLLAAAGVNLPMRFEVQHWNATVVGPQLVDAITLILSQWRNQGIAEVKTSEQTFGQSAGTTAIGNYQDAFWGVNPLTYQFEIGLLMRNQFYWPPEGIKGPPTLNVGYINNPQLSALAEKQLGQYKKEERVQTFRQIEDILAEEQYRIPGVTTSYNFFGDPSLKNMRVPIFAANGAIGYVKYWWFEK
jgi:glutathione transport system substrate-binding protein